MPLEPLVTDWITAIAGIVAALSVILVAVQTSLLKAQTQQIPEQLRLAREQIEKDHERSRRERAVEMILHWTQSLQRPTSSARQFAEGLGEGELTALYKRQALSADGHLGAHAKPCLEGTGLVPEERSGRIHLDQGMSSIIRWSVISYLNGLESIMSAWRHNVADREIIEEQFQYLFDGEGNTGIERLRAAFGGATAYPALTEFAKEMQSRRRIATGKPKLG